MAPFRFIFNLEGKKILEQLRTALVFDKLNFPALFSSLFCAEKSAGNFDFSKVCADPDCYRIIETDD